MKKGVWLILAGQLVLTGCARHYVMKLTNGSEIITASKPQVKEGIYHYKDAKGEEHFVAVSRVREIAPATMAKRDSKPQPVKDGSPKKRKWYLLWLY
ncbi:MAG TPA: YgdI/YgdR family lipoprotein [Candidatus Paceibacterota bacterium]|nr:YgdI/YgdR family lipoprotein [Verrucomicrobiota bacterium]HSA08790.1 YgdI/YgdR family lipoprotein [Candidatus Paceibacterota bacterium]